MLVGPHSTSAQQREMAKQIKIDPRNYVGQPTLCISTSPTLHDNITDNNKPTSTLAARHVDLRPFVLQGDELTVTTGGLTRVALEPGSLVVNSSQGGGSKDTWVVETMQPSQEQE